MSNINILGFVKAFVKTKNNMTTKDFLDNGYTMEHFIKYSTSHDRLSYDKVLETYKRVYENNAEIMEVLNND